MLGYHRILVQLLHFYIKTRRDTARDLQTMNKQSPNTDLCCNLCGEKITSVCMLSPDWSVCNMLTVAIINLRQHFKDKHGIEQPKEITT